MYACIYSARTTEIASAFSPAYELGDSNTAVFEAGSLKRIYRSWREIAEAIGRRVGPEGSITLAPNPDAAILIAKNSRGIAIVTRDPAPVLAPISIEALPLTPELLQTFDAWGIQTLGEFARLPVTGIAERFGQAGVYLQKLARGAVQRPLKIYRPETVYQDRLELDHPVSLLEPLLFLIARILNSLCERLHSNGMAANEVFLTLELEKNALHQRALHLPLPMRESKSLLKLLQMDLEALPPQAPICAVMITLAPVTPRRLQNGLYLPPTPEPGKLEITLARIRGWVGEENVGVPRLLDTHHPEPFDLQPGVQPDSSKNITSEDRAAFPQTAFRYFRPPLPAQVEMRAEQLAHIRASGISGKVALLSGPWRTSGNWWTSTQWDRDEWDVALASGVFCRLYRESKGSWFVEGVYD